MKKRKLVLLSLDAMITEDVEYLSDRPLVKKILEECYKNAKKILEKHETLVLLIADSLMEYETLTKEQIESLVETGTIDGKDNKDEVAELKEQAKEKGIKGYTKMTKEELESALAEEE